MWFSAPRGVECLCFLLCQLAESVELRIGYQELVVGRAKAGLRVPLTKQPHVGHGGGAGQNEADER